MNKGELINLERKLDLYNQERSSSRTLRIFKNVIVVLLISIIVLLVSSLEILKVKEKQKI